ncbi:MAG TPA: hypothetical protein VIJ53_03065, partial [Acidobacteriaceae bacterium]
FGLELEKFYWEKKTRMGVQGIDARGSCKKPPKNYFNRGRAFDFGADAMKVDVLPLRIISAVLPRVVRKSFMIRPC